MDEFFGKILEAVLGHPSPATAGVLLLVCAGLGWLLWKRDQAMREENAKLIEQFQKQIDNDRQDLLEVIDKYHGGQISVLQAINDLKLLIATIGAKL